MTYLGNKDFLIEVAKGNVEKHSIIHLLGRNIAVGTSFVPVSIGGIYQTVQASGATTLRVKAGGNANDTAAGTGARQITLVGLDENWAFVIETLATAGASASIVSTTTFTRLYEVHVSQSGTYATISAGSHQGDIVIENGSGGTNWATISATDFARSDSEIGVYSIATGYTGLLLTSDIFTDSSKTTETLLFKRENIDETVAPYSPMLVLSDFTQKGGEGNLELKGPIKIIGPADVGFISKVDASTAEVDVDFEIMLVQD